MAQYSEATLRKHLGEKAFHRVYYFYGRERYLKKSFVEKLIRALCGGEPGVFDFQRFEGNVTARELSDALENLPMLAPKKCVLVEDMDASTLGDAEMDRFKELLGDLPETAALIFVDHTYTGTGKSRDKTGSLIRLAEKHGGVCVFEPWDKRKLQRYVEERLQKHGVNIPPGVAAYLLERIPPELDRVIAETDKLLHLGRSVTKEDIDLLCPATLEVSAFDLARLILRRDYLGALQKIGDFFDAREEPVMVLGALSMAFVDLYRAKAAVLVKKGSGEMAKDFGYGGKEFRAKNAVRDQGKFEMRELRAIIEILAEADMALKSTRADSRLILEKAVDGIFTQMH